MPDITFEDFRLGLNTFTSPFKLPPQAAQQLENFKTEGARLELPKDFAQHESVLVTGNATILGVYYDGNTRHVIILESTTLYDVSGGSKTSLKTGVSLVNDSQMTKGFGQAWLATGTQGLRVKYGETTAYNWGVTKEASAVPTVAVNVTTGNLNGTYTYAFSWVANDDSESNLSPASAEVAPATQQVTVTGLPTTNADPQVTKKRVYRKGGLKNDAYRYIGMELPLLTAGGTDNEGDDQLTGTTQGTTGYIHRDRFDPPPSFTQVEFWEGRLWGTIFNSSTLYASTAAMPFAFPTIASLDPEEGRTLEIGQDDGDVITGIVGSGDLLVIFKKNRHYRLQFNDFEDFDLKLARTPIGCISGNSITQFHEATTTGAPSSTSIGFLSHDGYYIMDATGAAIRISQPVDNVWDPASGHMASYDHRNRQLWCFMATNKAYVWRTDLQTWRTHKPHTGIFGSTISPTGHALLDGGADKRELIISNGGKLWEANSVNSTLDVVWESPRVSNNALGMADSQFVLDHISIKRAISSDPSDSLTMTVTVEDAARTYTLNAAALTGYESVIRLHSDLIGTWFSVKLHGAVGATWQIENLTVHYDTHRHLE